MAISGKIQSFGTEIRDQHHLICKMLKSENERIPPKTITYQSCKNFTEEQFKEASPDQILILREKTQVLFNI